MERPRNTRDGYTWRVVLIEELFRVDESGTVSGDRHSMSVNRSECPLCEYWMTRLAWQADNVRPILAPPDQFKADVGLGHVLPAMRQDDIWRYMEVDGENYHLLRFEEHGTPCLYKGTGALVWPSEVPNRPEIQIEGPIVSDSDWQANMHWLKPCKPSPVMEPDDPPYEPPPPSWPTSPIPVDPLTEPRGVTTPTEYGPAPAGTTFGFNWPMPLDPEWPRPYGYRTPIGERDD
jgi:hypothetical protein